MRTTCYRQINIYPDRIRHILHITADACSYTVPFNAVIKWAPTNQPQICAHVI